MFDGLKKAVARLGDGLQRLLASCPPPPDLPEEKAPFLVVGHRGSPGTRPENTIPSFDLAVRRGANAIEADLSMTSDGHVVVWHDWDPDAPIAILRQGGWEPHMKYRPRVPPGGPYRKRVSQLTLEDLRAHHGYQGRRGLIRKARARIPTLDELLEWASGQPGLRFLLLDIKVPLDEAALAPAMAASIARSIENHGPKLALALNTPHPEVLAALRTAAPQLDYSLDVEIPFGIVTEPDDYRPVVKAIRLGNRTACLGRPTLLTVAPWSTFTSLVLRDSILRARHNVAPGARRVERFIGWTINHPREMACLIRLGVTGILTDRSHRLRAIARRLGKTMD